MKRAVLVVVLVISAVSLACADVAVYSRPNGSFVIGAYKTLQRAKHVRRQITPGGNLVRAIFRSGACTPAVDAYTASWSCAATVSGKFRAARQAATSETQVVYEWNAARQEFTVTADAPVITFVAENNFSVSVEVQRGDQSFVAAVGVEEVVPGSRCRAFYTMSATSDVSPVRAFNATTRHAAVSRMPCGVAE